MQFTIVEALKGAQEYVLVHLKTKAVKKAVKETRKWYGFDVTEKSTNQLLSGEFLVSRKRFLPNTMFFSALTGYAHKNVTVSIDNLFSPEYIEKVKARHIFTKKDGSTYDAPITTADPSDSLSKDEIMYMVVMGDIFYQKLDDLYGEQMPLPVTQATKVPEEDYIKMPASSSVLEDNDDYMTVTAKMRPPSLPARRNSYRHMPRRQIQSESDKSPYENLDDVLEGLRKIAEKKPRDMELEVFKTTAYDVPPTQSVRQKVEITPL